MPSMNFSSVPKHVHVFRHFLLNMALHAGGVVVMCVYVGGGQCLSFICTQFAEYNITSNVTPYMYVIIYLFISCMLIHEVVESW